MFFKFGKLVSKLFEHLCRVEGWTSRGEEGLGMLTQKELEINDQLLHYLNGQIKLHEFEDWFAPTLWHIDECHDKHTIELAGAIHILLAEFSCGDRTEASLREELARIATPLAPSIAENRNGDR